IVVHDERALPPRLGPGFRLRRARAGRGRCFPDGQPDLELAPPPRARARGAHAAAMELDQGADEGEPDAEPAGRMSSLLEQIEEARQEIGRDADAVVAHAERDAHAVPFSL